MPDTPTPNNQPTGEGPSSSSSRTRLMMATGILLAVIAVVVIVVLLVTGGDDTSGANDTVAGGSITDVTSPYDVHELPDDASPSDVKEATLVSISLVTVDGGAQYFGLSSDTEAAKALIDAIAGAKALDAADATTEAASGDGQGTVSTITFLLPDRGTLLFELDVEQGIISRGGRSWQVEDDLSALIDEAVTYQ